MSKSTGIEATTVMAVVEGFMEEAAEEKFKAVNQATHKDEKSAKINTLT